MAPGQRGSLYVRQAAARVTILVSAIAGRAPQPTVPFMQPPSLALVEDDEIASAVLLSVLRQQGVPSVQRFADSEELLAHPSAFDFGFYLVDLGLPGIDGVDLIRVLRRRSQAGVVVVSARSAEDAFEACLQAGADMFLAKPVRPEQLRAAVGAVYRRAAAPARPDAQGWRVDTRAGVLVAPDGARIRHSATEMALLLCFAESLGAPVTRERLLDCLDPVARGAAGNQVHAAIYRLRRRIQAGTPVAVPLVSHSRVGYVFLAPLATV